MPKGLGFGIGISLTGDKELLRKLDRLGKRGYRSTVAKAASKAMTPVSKLAKRLARAGEGTGLLSKSIGKKSKWYGGTRVVIIGPRKGFKRAVTTKSGKSRFVNPAKYAHLVELGHSIVAGGEVVGHVPARPFLRPALFQNRTKIIGIMRRELRAGLLREAKKK